MAARHAHRWRFQRLSARRAPTRNLKAPTCKFDSQALEVFKLPPGWLDTIQDHPSTSIRLASLGTRFGSLAS
eukprot:15442823-Alexandrium_andersonii.AAC.1